MSSASEWAADMERVSKSEPPRLEVSGEFFTLMARVATDGCCLIWRGDRPDQLRLDGPTAVKLAQWIMATFAD